MLPASAAVELVPAGVYLCDLKFFSVR